MVGWYELQKLFNGNGFIEWLIVSIISSMSLIFLNILYFKQILNVKTSKKKDVLVLVFDTILRVVTSMIIAAPFYRLINIITSILIMKFIYKTQTEKCILGESINALTIICTEAIFSKIICNMINNVDTYFNGMYDYKYKAYIALAILLSRSIIYIIIKKFNMKINIPENPKGNTKRNIIVLCVLISMLMYFNALEMSVFEVNFPFGILILDIISLVICFYMSMKNIIEITEIEEQSYKIETLEAYNKTLSIMHDNIKGFRHDFGNIVQALTGYIDTQNYEGLKRMRDSLMKECKEVNNMKILDPNIIKNPGIYSVITNKYHKAQQQDIIINVDVDIDFSEIDPYTYELCRILGILLDNAIEAASECEDKVINVILKKDEKVERNLIIIQNTYNQTDIDIDKIFEKGYTSKKIETEDHGLGLWNVRKILNKINKLSLYTTKGNMFSQQVEIYK